MIGEFSDIVQTLRETKSGELELRIGKKIDGKFVSGVDYETFQEIHNDLMSCDSIQKEETWHETMDVFFDYNKKEFRTRVKYSNTTMMVVPETVVKKKIKQCHASCDNYEFRISLSSEQKCNKEDLPPIVDPKYIRLKHSKNFYIIKNDTKIWRIDIRKSWAADDRTSVEKKQHNEPPNYEIECELVDINNYLNSKTNNYILESIIMKGLAIIGKPEASYKLYK